MAKYYVEFSPLRMYRRTIVALVTFAATMVLLPGAACSQTSVPTKDESATRVEIGDSVQVVERALHIAEGATATDDMRQDPGQIHLQARGIWIFFNGLRQAYQY
jgi:hypothetical protein